MRFANPWMDCRTDPLPAYTAREAEKPKLTGGLLLVTFLGRARKVPRTFRRETRAAVILSVLLWAFQGSTSIADERILNYHSDITVHQDASMTVTETITVRAERNQIKRGIYRDFPTRYKDDSGQTL